MRRVGIAAICACLALAGCGSDDDSKGAGSAGGAGGSSGSGGSGGSGAAGSGGAGGAGGGAGAGAGSGGGTIADRFPLSHTSGERFLREASGKPFFFHGDTAWSLIAQLSKEDAELYLEDRRQKGFTVILVSLLEHQFADDAPANAYGDAPFTSEGDYATPNAAYFAHADWVIDTARDKGLLVLLTPSYIGYGGGDEGFYQEMIANGPQKLEAYGHFLGQRYAPKPNIAWVNAGDYDPPTPDLVNAIANGIRAEDSLHLHTAHTARGESASAVWGEEPWLDVDNIYTDAETHDPALALYAQTTKPFFLIEGYYEGEHDMSEAAIRYQAYGALLGGAMGHVFGNNPIWCLGAATCFPTSATPPTWQAQLDGRGSLDMAVLGKALAPLGWEELVPSSNLLSQDSTEAVAARVANGSLGVVYTRSLGSFDIDLSGFSVPITAQRIDPTNGSASALTGSPFSTSGKHTVTLAETNATGTEDWLVTFTGAPF